MNIIILIILTTLPAILIGKYIYKNDTNKKNKTIRNEHIYMMRNYDLAMAY